MKTKLFLLSLFTLLIFGCGREEPSDSTYTIGAEKYYMYQEQKIYLYEIIGLSVVQLDTTQNFEVSLKQLKANSNFTSVDVLRENGCLVVVTSKLSIKEIKQQPAVINAMPAYSSKKSTEFLKPVFLTGELILQTKEGFSIEDVRHLFNNKATVKAVDSSNRCTLQVKNWNQIFDLGNSLHKHEKVLYCEPNKFGGFGVCQ